MGRYLAIGFGLIVFFLLLFGLAHVAGLTVLTEDPAPWMTGGVGAGVAGVGLLVIDVLLPVPSSAVMLLHGALFGAVLGTALSVVGSVGATLVAFAIGRRGGPLMARLVSEGERRRADALFQRWGVLAIVVSRPMPLLAETVAILAGTTALSWPRALTAAVVGCLPAAVVYGVVGASVATLESGVVTFVAVMAVAAITWWVGRRVERAG